jgi:hypothetical protein
MQNIIARRFLCTLIPVVGGPVSGGRKVALSVPRTEAQLEALRRRFGNEYTVHAVQVEVCR